MSRPIVAENVPQLFSGKTTIGDSVCFLTNGKTDLTVFQNAVRNFSKKVLSKAEIW